MGQAAVVQLRSELDVVLMHGLHHALEAGQDPLLPQRHHLDRVWIGRSERVHRFGSGYDHARSTSGSLHQVFNQLVGDAAVIVDAKSRVHAGHNDPVLHFHGAYLQGLEEVSQLLQSRAPYSWSIT